MTPYQSLERLFGRLRSLNDAAGILGWDAQTLMPTGAAEGRSDQLATLRGLAHELLVAPSTADLLDAAEARVADLDAWQAANLGEMRRAHAHAVAVPGDLVEAESKASSAAEMAWREARAMSDFSILAPHLAEMLRLSRAVGEAKGAALGLAPYDALLDQYDPGLRRARIDPLFDRLRAEIPGLIRAACERQARQGLLPPVSGAFPVAAQRAVGERLMGDLGFDFARGRLDTSLHPFCGGATSDVRQACISRSSDWLSCSVMPRASPTGWPSQRCGRPCS